MSKRLAGRFGYPAENSFEVTLHMGTKRIPHPLDDELAQKVGLKNYDELHQQAIGTANNKLRNKEQMLLAQQVTMRLLDRHQFKVPSWLVLMESQNAVRNMGRNWNDLSDEEIELFNEGGEKSVRLSMILDSVREAAPESVFSTQEILEKLRIQIAQQGKDPIAILSKAEKDGTLLGEITRLRDEATIQWIIHVVLLIIVAPLIAIQYYKSGDRVNGFLLGLVFLITGIILDLIITYPLFITTQGTSLQEFFLQWQMLVGYTVLIVSIGIYHIIKNK